MTNLWQIHSLSFSPDPIKQVKDNPSLQTKILVKDIDYINLYKSLFTEIFHNYDVLSIFPLSLSCLYRTKSTLLSKIAYTSHLNPSMAVCDILIYIESSTYA